MALIECPECKRQVSSAAASCPQCGYPIAETVQTAIGESVPGLDADQQAMVRRDLAAYQPGLVPDAEVAVLLSQKKQTNHVLHLLLSILTMGVWLIVWFLVADGNSRHNRRIDERIRYGATG